MKSVFEDFTNQYALSKTLRFELRPILNTEQMLVDNSVFVEDGVRREKYEQSKIYFDRLHREFVTEALTGFRVTGLAEYLSLFQAWSQNKKDKKTLEALRKKEKSLRQAIVQQFNEYAKKWAEGPYKHLKLTKKSTELFFEDGVFSLLSDRYGAEAEAHIVDPETGKKVTLFDGWKGFTGYFKKFYETRKNFYTDDGTTTALATRMIDQNLRRFCENIRVFGGIKEKIDCTPIEHHSGVSMVEVFSSDFYSQCLLQEGIDTYNRIVGGEVLANGEKKQGINELVNKYRQDHKGEKLPFLKTLEKQILSEKEKRTFGIENLEQCFTLLQQFHTDAVAKVSVLRRLSDGFVDHSANFDLDKVYFSHEALNTLTHRWLADGESFERTLSAVFKEAKDNTVKHTKEDDLYIFPDGIPLDCIKRALERKEDAASLWKARYYKADDTEKGMLSGNESVWQQFLLVWKQEFGSLFQRREIDQTTGKSYEAGYDISQPIFMRLLQTGALVLNDDTREVIKNFADDVLRIYQMGKYFSLEKHRVWNTEYPLDSLFYEHPETGYTRFYTDAYDMIVRPYNDLRNYLTKKKYSEQKWKLNFENGSDFLGGWDQNQEPNKYGAILRKDGKYYLGIFKKEHRNNIFRKGELGSWSSKIVEAYSGDDHFYEKMEYKAIADASKDISLLLSRASEANLRLFDPSQKVLQIKKDASYKKGDRFDVKDLHCLIDYYKSAILLYRNWQCYNFHFQSTKSYQNIKEFTDDIARDGYKVWFEKVSQSYIEKKNREGELYLFEIYNQDFSRGKTGTKNLHTLYWEGLFAPENMQDFLLKLNGEAEIFYRPATSIEILGQREETKGQDVTRHKRYADTEKQKTAQVAHKRYAENKILFHCPITINRGKGEAKYFNAQINEVLIDYPEINVIGVDRGEKHLAYYSIINQKQEILESGSLNVVGGVDYANKLEAKARMREQARRDWQSVQGIKDLKKGYISQVVRRLADLAIKHNAIIVLEDLNMRFKQIRGGIEKSIYQQLEKALIDKLSFLVEKGETGPEKAGHLLRAYQLTAPFTSFKEMGRQTGIVFYTQASYTSKIDPLTGWRPNLYLKYVNAEKSREDIGRFLSIKYESGKKRFEFSYDLKDFQVSTKEVQAWPSNTKWTVSSCVERFRWNKSLNQNNGGYDHYVNVTENFKQLFEQYGIDSMQNIKQQIMALYIMGNEKFFKEFVFLWNLVCQIRNTDPSKAKDDPCGDFILSPVAPFFDSRTAEKFGTHLPKNGDDNGAYNIARKGLVILEKIKAFKKKTGSCQKLGWGDLYISHSDWDTFAQRKRL